MARPINITHPLKNHTGLSQRTRLLDALNTLSAPIEGKTWSDWLFEISERAQHINFHRLVDDRNDGAHRVITNWSSFFSDSLPFQLARFSKIRVDDLKVDFNDLFESYSKHPTEGNLELVFLQIWDRLIVPIDRLYFMLDKAQHSFTEPLKRVVEESFASPVKQYVRIHNAGNRFLCLCKKDFSHFAKPPWEFQSGELTAWSKTVQEIQGGKREALQKIGQLLKSLVSQLLEGVGEIAGLSADQIQESLLPQQEALSERHQPHLALMLAFLELYTHLQADLNSLGQKHLDFFYRQVLHMSPRGAIGDKAFLVFEISKHIDTHRIKSDTLVKNGKDDNQQDIVFGLDDELLLDKAKVQEVRTLFLNTAEEDIQLDTPTENQSIRFVEGVYAASVANSADGLGAAFTEDQSKNWPTLGAKYSKTISLVEGNIQTTPHSHARIGFVLASPVLLLQEGKRRLVINLVLNLPQEDAWGLEKICAAQDEESRVLTQESLNNSEITKELSESALEYFDDLILKNQVPLIIGQSDWESFKEVTNSNDDPIFNSEDREVMEENIFISLQSLPMRLFQVCLSGEKEWIPADDYVSSMQLTLCEGFNPEAGETIGNLEITLDLPDDFPVITFFDSEVLKERLDLARPLPAVKVLFDENSLMHFYDTNGPENSCAISKKQRNRILTLSPYHFIRNLQITDATINVEVCGVKNLIVQNEESLQDVNKPIYPFGLRPKAGNHFYIGSKEVFYKNWESLRLNIEWKDKPSSLSEHYCLYSCFSGNDTRITNQSFQFKGEVLDRGEWISVSPEQQDLFGPESDDLQDCHDGELILTGNIAGEVNSTDEIPEDQPLHSDESEHSLLFDECDQNYTPYIVSKSTPYDCELPPFPITPLLPRSVQTDHGFFRMTLEGADFQHDRFQKVLALSMLELNNPSGSNKCNKLFTPERTDAAVPSEPYTPIIGHISIDYCAVAKPCDIELVHLGPFENTSKQKDMEGLPTLLPDYEDEGNLFIGLSDIRPGGTLSLLFQLAEATADTEMAKAPVQWHYLSENEWKELRTGFEIVDDGTHHLTQSGIVKIALPTDINTEGNTLMPDHLYWIKASACKNVQTIAETIAIHTQAVQASARLTPLNDTERLVSPLEAGSLAKLVTSDAGVNKVEQPYISFGARLPELSGPFYTRVSEQLRHKGRALAVHDYETLLIGAFPEIYKAKCIPHTLGLSAHKYRRDLEVAPGYVAIVVIPDLTKLQVGDQLKPTVPLGLLQRMEAYLKNRISPFARLQIVNPRYEPVDVQIEVEFHSGRDETYYRAQLAKDITHFLAPWHLGDSEKLAFGQKLFFSDVIGFVERLDYIDHILEINLYGLCDQRGNEIQPITARSILTGGNIVVSIPSMEIETPYESLTEPVNQ